MNMCLLEVAMCEKCRGSHFESEGECKKFEDWGGGLKKFRIGGGYRFGGISTPLNAMFSLFF